MERKLLDALRWIVGILRKHEVPFQVSGGFAAHLYGSRRAVNDIDIDILEESFDTILPDVERYIVYGPDRYTDEKWDLELMTLQFNGQEIDIGGTRARIRDGNRWVDSSHDLAKVEMMRVGGMEIPVIPPDELIAYKELLSGEHQKEDIAAVQRFIARR